jgi:hypothetical protein
MQPMATTSLDQPACHSPAHPGYAGILLHPSWPSEQASTTRPSRPAQQLLTQHHGLASHALMRPTSAHPLARCHHCAPSFFPLPPTRGPRLSSLTSLSAFSSVRSKSRATPPTPCTVPACLPPSMLTTNRTSAWIHATSAIRGARAA